MNEDSDLLGITNFMGGFFLDCEDGYSFVYLETSNHFFSDLYTFSSDSVDSGNPACFWLLGRERLRRSLPPGLDDAFPYQIIPITAISIPKITCKLRPSFPKKMNPNIKTRIVFICPSTWNDTAVNLPMQMNWLRLVPTAMLHDSTMKNYKPGRKHHISYSSHTCCKQI